jgi:hypothetical protein
MTEERFIQRDEPLLKVPRKKILFYAGLQLIGVAATVAISQTIAAIGQSNPSVALGHLIMKQLHISVSFPYPRITLSVQRLANASFPHQKRGNLSLTTFCRLPRPYHTLDTSSLEMDAKNFRTQRIAHHGRFDGE